MTLATADDILRCKDGKNWTVTRARGHDRLPVASGALPAPIAPVTGSVAVSLATDDEANAAGRLSIIKRYRSAIRGERQ